MNLLKRRTSGGNVYRSYTIILDLPMDSVHLIMTTVYEQGWDYQLEL